MKKLFYDSLKGFSLEASEVRVTCLPDFPLKNVLWYLPLILAIAHGAAMYT